MFTTCSKRCCEQLLNKCIFCILADSKHWYGVRRIQKKKRLGVFPTFLKKISPRLLFRDVHSLRRRAISAGNRPYKKKLQIRFFSLVYTAFYTLSAETEANLKILLEILIQVLHMFLGFIEYSYSEIVKTMTVFFLLLSICKAVVVCLFVRLFPEGPAFRAVNTGILPWVWKLFVE